MSDAAGPAASSSTSGRIPPAVVRVVNALLNGRPDADEAAARHQLALVCGSPEILERAVALFVRWKALNTPRATGE